MSGVYIPGMEMPTSCIECFAFKSNASGQLFCKAKRIAFGKDDAEWLPKRTPNWCPLVPVTPHGRLIDADALYEKFLLLESEAMSALQTTSIGSVDGIKWSAILTERTGYKFDIVDAPTIIPASPVEVDE